MDLKGNKLETLPAAIGQLSCLQRLDLKGNKLETLPVEIGQLFCLQRLELSGNKLGGHLTKIGRLLGQLPHLQHKEAMRELRNQRKNAVLEELEVDEVRDGVVSRLVDFGAFVNINGTDGLIRIRELSWSRVNHPSEVLTVGQQVRVKVISVKKERKRIGLSLRQLQPQPWDTLTERYQEGDLVRGVITRIKHFGAFARLVGESVEGLIHISEMSHDRIERAEQVVAVGEEYVVRIIRLDIQRRRMGLSIKQAEMDAAENGMHSVYF